LHRSDGLLVGGRQETRIDSDLLASAHSPNPTVFQHPKELGLQTEWYLGNHIEEQSPPVGELEAAPAKVRRIDLLDPTNSPKRADRFAALGMIAWILENDAYDAGYLENTNRAAADADGEPTWSDSTYLVGTFTDGENQQFQRYVTAGELGIPNVPPDGYVVWSGGQARGYNQVPHGDLDVTVSLNLAGAGTVVAQSAFTLLRESALSKSRSEYSAICGVSVDTMESLASEFVRHGKKAVAMTYRGPIKHTNGLYNQLAIQHLNTLIGNYDWSGGCTAGAGGWSHKSGVVRLGEVTGDPGHEGIRIDRAKTFYNQSEAGNLFTGYPARRPWFPFGTHGNYQEVIPSLQDEYPYGLKVLITYWNAWPYSVPALRRVFEETVADENKLPLLVAISPVMGEVAAWADYVLPDTVYLEKFAVPGIPWRVNKGTAFQRPVVGKFDGRPIGVSPANGGVGNGIPVNGINDYTPALPDTKAVLDIHIGLARALGLPGVGAGALVREDSTRGNLHNGWDWAKAQLQNIAANAQEKHPGVTIDEILSRGGVFDNPGDEYSGPRLTHQYANIIRTFIDPIARTKDSVTGEYYAGFPYFKPLTHSDGAPLSDPEFPYRLITYKTVHHGLLLPSLAGPLRRAGLHGLNISLDTLDPKRFRQCTRRGGLARVMAGLSGLWRPVSLR
jgi:anaerobic selenocysteine-containing dehydrogenase